MNHFLADELVSVEAFERQLEILHQKYLGGGISYFIEQDGVSLSAMTQDSKNFCRALVKEIRAGRYALQPAHLRMIKVGEKERLIYKFRVTDLLIHGVVSRAIMQHFLPLFSKNLYSYIKGRNWWDAVNDFSAYARAYFRSESDKRKLGLYVLRRDIAKYTDSIPVGDSSPVWDILRREMAFPKRPNALEKTAWQLCVGVVRTEALTLEDEMPFTNLVGVPTGSPISTTLFNVYMIELDRRLDALKPGFYARYGDDLIFADTDPNKAKTAVKVIRDTLTEHRLRSNLEKSRDIYFTGAGRASTAWPEAKGNNRVDFLGCFIASDATVSLGPKNTRALLTDIDGRLRRLAANFPAKASEDERGRLASQIVNEALNPDSPLAQKSAGLLRFAITDRESLRELDREIMLRVLRCATGSTSVKVFRRFSPLKIRRGWKLVSLFHMRNQQGKKKPGSQKRS